MYFSDYFFLIININEKPAIRSIINSYIDMCISLYPHTDGKNILSYFKSLLN